MLCVVAPKSICGSGDRARNEAGASTQAFLFLGAPEYVQQGLPGSTTPSPRYPTVGEEGEEKKYRRQDSKGLLRRSPGHSVNGSSQAAKENGGGWGGGREAGELGRHSSSCNFRICGHICVPSSEKNPPTPHHAPATVCLTQSSKTLKKPKVLLHPFGEEGG